MKRGARIALLAALLAGAAAVAHAAPPVYVVIFTHVEDNTPGGALGSAQSRQAYLTLRSNLIAMADLALGSGVQWTLQPDWKMLEAALVYETDSLRATTNGKNVLRFLRDDRGAVIDPHSHENGGYNYTDVAYLLDLLGVGGSTVIGGHVWDPSLAQFSEWDRFRVPVAGTHYPSATWRGDILIGSGTPNHVNDPLISGVWRPKDRDHYFDDDPNGNIVAIGQWKSSVATVQELIGLYRSGAVPPTAMLTFSRNVNPQTLGAPNGLASVADTVIAPIVAWRDSGLVETTDFTSLIHTWQTVFGAQAYVYDDQATVGVDAAPRAVGVLELACIEPNPVRTTLLMRYALSRATRVRLSVFDLAGREVAVVADGPRDAGEHVARWDARVLPSGAYWVRLAEAGDRSSSVARRIAILH